MKIIEYLNEIEKTLKETRKDIREAYKKGLVKIARKKKQENKMWNRKLKKDIDYIIFRINEIEDTQKKILELMKRMREERKQKGDNEWQSQHGKEQ